MRIFNISLIVFFILSVFQLKAQDPIFSQLNTNDTYLNPANTFNAINSDVTVKLDLHFRDQWNNVAAGDNYSTSKVQAEYNFYKSNYDCWNAGLIFMSDRSNTGYLKQTSFQAVGSYSRVLSGGSSFYKTSMITIGSSVGFGQTNVDLSNLWFGRQFDLMSLTVQRDLDSGEQFTTDEASFIDVNLGGRFMRYLDKKSYFIIAAGMSHLNRPSLSETNSSINYTPRINFQAEALFPITNNLYHKPSIVFVKQSWAYQFVPAYLLSMDLDNAEDDFALSTGVSARIVNGLNGTILDAMILHLGIASTQWHLKFSFDINTSTLQQATNGVGAIELSLGYNIIPN